MAFLTYRASSNPTLPTSNTVNSNGLSNLEVDANFASLDSAKFEKTGGAISGDVAITGNLSVSGYSTSINSTNLSIVDANVFIGNASAVSALTGTISTSATVSTLTMTSPNTTAGLIPGMTLTKTTGTPGAFGSNAVITSVDSLTQITVTALTANTAGSLSFNVGGATDATANGGGIILKGTSDKTIIWDNINSNWTSSENFNIPSNKAFKIDNASVLNYDTLGTGITKSSLTKLGITTAGVLKSDASGNITSDTSSYFINGNALSATTGAFTGDVTIGGSLTLNGLVTTINSNTIAVDDKNIELGSVTSVSPTGNLTVGSAVVTNLSSTANIIPGSAVSALSGASSVTLPANTVVVSVDSSTQITLNNTMTGTGSAIGATLTIGGSTDATANGGGITLKGATNKTIIWDNINSNWTSSEHWNLASGKEFKINNVSVLSSTTLGSAVTSSSLTKIGTKTAGFVKSDASGNLTVDTNTYLTAESDDLSTVTGRGATTTTASTFSGGLTASGSTAITLGNATANIITTNTAGVSFKITTLNSATGATGSLTLNTGDGLTTNSISITPGTSTSTAAGSAGSVNITGGASTGNNASANPGNVIIKGGSNSTNSGSGGNVQIDGGVGGSFGIAGSVSIGTSSASAITIGASAITTTVNGTVKLPTVGTSGFVTLGTGGQLSATAATTTNISEGTNLYYTDARARSAISASGIISYNSTTGAMTGAIPSSITLTGLVVNTINGDPANGLSISANANAPITSGTAGNTLYLNGGPGSDTTSAGAGGSVQITGGRSGINATSGGGTCGGSVTLSGGNGNTLNAAAVPGDVNIYGGSAQCASQSGGNIYIQGSNGYPSGNSNGGNVYISSGKGIGTGNNGNIRLAANSIGATGAAPYIGITAGTYNSGRFTIYGLSVGTTTDSDTTAGAGSILATGNITSSSDIRIKTNIEKIENALNKVLQLNGYTFDRTDIEISRQTGVIAQEVLKVLPEAVSGSEETTYSVSYGNMMGLMIEAIKELNAKVQDLQNQLANK